MPAAAAVDDVGHQISGSTAVPKPALGMVEVHTEAGPIVPFKEGVYPADVAGIYPRFNRKTAVGAHVQTGRSRRHHIRIAPVEVERLADFTAAVADATQHRRRVVPRYIAAVA